ncbi:regulatory protein [Paramicrobacterium humi]|uniref:Regulatory protein RecX n=1 Tax=Paramicrobacterium humi TaxID=640635 RepID=A0A1H4PSU3_9MICO|nr:regulatory protein RecX [Microbacterium humi]SEC10324.1 regulatory protein [Microbacterium humi]
MVAFRPSDGEKLAPVTSLDAHRGERRAPEAESEDAPPALPDLEAAAVRALSRRNLTEREVAKLVREKGGDARQAEAVLERLRELGYVDDSRVAEELVHRLADGRGKSRAVVAREMAARGVPSDIGDAALDGISDEHERTVAVELALKRGAQLSSADDQAFTRRLTGYLARRGYAGDIVREAVAAAAAERRSSVRFR